MNRIKILREEKGIYQKDLAKLLNVSTPAINYYENEKRTIDTKTASILADYFNVSIDYLLGKSDIRNPEKQSQDNFEFAFHKESEGLTEEDIKEALRIYKQIKYGKNKEK